MPETQLVDLSQELLKLFIWLHPFDKDGIIPMLQQLLFQDALSKNYTKQNLYGYIIKELIYRSLAILNMQVNARDIDVEFADPLPTNEQELANTIKLEIESGIISKQTGSEETGHDWADEQMRMASESQTTGAGIGSALMEEMRKLNSVGLVDNSPDMVSDAQPTAS